jgi:hypothetical protein
MVRRRYLLCHRTSLLQNTVSLVDTFNTTWCCWSISFVPKFTICFIITHLLRFPALFTIKNTNTDLGTACYFYINSNPDLPPVSFSQVDSPTFFEFGIKSLFCWSHSLAEFFPSLSEVWSGPITVKTDTKRYLSVSFPEIGSMKPLSCSWETHSWVSKGNK